MQFVGWSCRLFDWATCGDFIGSCKAHSSGSDWKRLNVISDVGWDVTLRHPSSLDLDAYSDREQEYKTNTHLMRHASAWCGGGGSKQLLVCGGAGIMPYDGYWHGR
ncbi:hypothetical protein Syun_016765 [Stephania yunnanensis]|uniref:Uncharacterized protein n=1 Tax=Stephania yunnanensis TaxID=152371 RepID=A0AAP0J7Z1_9MAGN